ncbi:hypothetical protein SEA_FIZZLES_98 [Microbacterium phage Fizzles]|nr:hypothetical protein SEA_FIZZLES_98 [Microbacterium phage Fizzles]
MIAVNVRRPELWGRVERAELDALEIIRRDPETIFAAALAYRDGYATYAIVHLGDADMLPPGTPYFNAEGEKWVHDLHARYLVAVHESDEPTLIEIAGEWVRCVGTAATVNILRFIEQTN